MISLSPVRYVDLYSLPEPSDNIGNVLLHVARRLNARTPGIYVQYIRMYVGMCIAPVCIIRIYSKNSLKRQAIDKEITKSVLVIRCSSNQEFLSICTLP